MAVLKWGKDLVTTDGRKARVLTNNLKGARPYVVAVDDGNGNETVYTYPADGKYLQSAASGSDLVNEARTFEGLFNVYKPAANGDFNMAGPYITADDADSNADLKKRIARVRIKFVEGQMDA